MQRRQKYINFYTLLHQRVYSAWNEAKEMATLPYAENWCAKYACRKYDISFPPSLYSTYFEYVLLIQVMFQHDIVLLIAEIHTCHEHVKCSQCYKSLHISFLTVRSTKCVWFLIFVKPELCTKREDLQPRFSGQIMLTGIFLTLG